MKEVISQLTMLIIRDPNKADPNPATENPGMTPDTIIKSMAFITKVKRPRVKMLIGKVIKNNIGRKNAFSIPNNPEANKADKNPLAWIPSIR